VKFRLQRMARDMSSASDVPLSRLEWAGLRELQLYSTEPTSMLPVAWSMISIASLVLSREGPLLSENDRVRDGSKLARRAATGRAFVNTVWAAGHDPRDPRRPHASACATHVLSTRPVKPK
jgi:hypothetical protein